MPLSRKKISLLHVAKARLGIGDDAWRDMLARTAGVTSSKDLDQAGFPAVMEVLEAAGFKSDFGAANFGNLRRWDMATPGQIALIWELWLEVTNGEGTEEALDKWIERFGVSSRRFLTKDKASKDHRAQILEGAPRRQGRARGSLVSIKHFLSAAERRARHLGGTLPKILSDPELQEFVDALLPTRTFGEIAQRCRERFGPSRAPSKSTISRYWLGLIDPNGPDLTARGAVHGRARCLWCGSPLSEGQRAARQPHKRFCNAPCRVTMHTAARRWAIEAIADGRLSIAELRRHASPAQETIEN